MTETPLATLTSGGAFFEGPRWHDGRLFVSDFWRYQVFAVAPDGTTETVAEVPGAPSGLGWLPDGDLLVVSMQDAQILRVAAADGTVSVHADLGPFADGGQANDMVVDAAGRAYVGTIDFMAWGEGKTTDVVRVDPDGAVTAVAAGLSFPNGMVLTPDGATLIVAESWSPRLTAFDVGPDGGLTNRRDWAVFTSDDESREPITPDGIALDAEGAVWVADAAGNRAVRVREGGEVVATIDVPDLGIYACALGGDDGRTLFLCAAPTFDSTVAAETLEARVLTYRVDVPHAGHP